MTANGNDGLGDTVAVTRQGAFAALAYRDYLLLWLGQATHAFALWMENIARPLLVLQLTNNDAAQLGAVIAVRTIPTLLLGLWAGVVADWFDRQKVLLVTKIASFLTSAAFALLLLSGHMELWHIYVLVFFRGAVQAFDQPARASLIPSIVPASMITSAMALLSSTQNLMRILGAAGAGISVAIMGLEGTFLFIAALYIGGIVATIMMRVKAHERPTERGAGAMLDGMLEGLKFARSRPEIRGVLLVALIHFTFGMVYMQVFAPLFAVDILDIGSGGLGLLLSFTGVGALSAALLIARNPPARIGVVIPLGVSGMGLVLVAFSLSTYLGGFAALVLSIGLLTIVGAFQTTFMSLSRALLVQAAPDELRGRVLSLISLDRAAMAGGATLGGFVAAGIGVQVAQIIFGLICIVGGLIVFWLTPDLRRFRIEETYRPITRRAGVDGTEAVRLPSSGDNAESAAGIARR